MTVLDYPAKTIAAAREDGSIAALVLANLAPLAGVVFLGWDVGVIMLLYWCENVVAGFYTILKIACLPMDLPVEHLVGKTFAILFFLFHFGAFCGVHGVFLLAFMGEFGGWARFDPQTTWPGPLAFPELFVSVIAHLWRQQAVGLAWPVLVLLGSHGISFFRNYLGKKEYEHLTMKKLMEQPYSRIVLLHITIIAAGLPVLLLGSPLPLLFVIVAIKIMLDVRLHQRSHRMLQQDQAEAWGLGKW